MQGREKDQSSDLNAMISSYRSFLSSSRVIVSFLRSKSKKEGSRGGATGSSSGSSAKLRVSSHPASEEQGRTVVSDVRVLECFFDGDARLGVERQLRIGAWVSLARRHRHIRGGCTHSLFQEVVSKRRGVRVQRGEASSLAEGESADIVPRATRGDGVELVRRGSAEDFEDEGELMVVCRSARKPCVWTRGGRAYNLVRGRADAR